MVRSLRDATRAVGMGIRQTPTLFVSRLDRTGIVVLATVALISSAVAQESGRPATQAPVATFRTSIDAIQLDVYVTDAAGNIVEGLTAADFELVEDGKAQPITTFEAVNIPLASETGFERDSAEPDVARNDMPPGRAFVIALGEVGYGPRFNVEPDGSPILKAKLLVEQFIRDHFGPNDIGAVVIVDRGLATDGQDFTSNRQLLLDAVSRWSGNFPGAESCPAGATIRSPCRSRQMYSLRDVIESLARIPGRHKTMLYFEKGIDVDMLDLVDYNGGVLGFTGDDAHAAMMAATRSNLRIYPIDPGGLGTTLTNTLSLRSLGEITGGFAVANTNRFTEHFERIVRENSVYYMIGFNSGYEKRDGRYVPVQIRVKRPGLTAHARAGYVAPTRLEQTARERATAAPAGVAGALASPLPTSGVTIRAVAAPLKASRDRGRVELTVDIDAGTLGLVERDGAFTGQVELRYLATDAGRKVYPEVRHRATINIHGAPGTVSASIGDVRLRLLSSIELPKGRHQVRIAAGAGPLNGSVVADVNVPDFASEPLVLSGLSLAAPLERNVLALRPDGVSTGAPIRCHTSPCTPPPATGTAAGTANNRSPESVTTSRDFTTSTPLALIAEVYDNRRGDSGGAEQTITLTTELVGRDGLVYPLAQEARPSRVTSRDGTTHRFEQRLPLTEVVPGSYALRVQARASADPERVVSRSVPIRIR
jgi:VWFA-related protein